MVFEEWNSVTSWNGSLEIDSILSRLASLLLGFVVFSLGFVWHNIVAVSWLLKSPDKLFLSL